MQETDGTFLPALIKGLSQVFTWLLVIVGWIVVSDQQYHRELIKARRDKLDEVRKKLADLEASSRKFHSTNYDVDLMQSIMRNISAVSLELSLLRNESIVGVGTTNDMVTLRQSITGQNFDPGSHTAGPHTLLLTKIDEAHRTLDSQLAAASNLLHKKRQTILESIRDIRKRLY